MRRNVAALLTGLLLVGVMVRATSAEARPPQSGPFSYHYLPAAQDGAYPGLGYWLYVPRKLAPNPRRSLVTVLHGCTQNAQELARGVGWNHLADRHGFVVVYPEQSVPSAGETDGSPARCWNWGEAAVYPRGQGELESIARISRAVARQYRTNSERSFLVGLSSGAFMASTMAATYPDLYRGLASVAGCSYLCSDPTGDLAYSRMGSFARPMPTFVVTGTADYLTNPAMGELTVTQWLGTNDLVDDGEHNGSVHSAPTTVEHRDLDALTAADPTSGDACLHDSPRNPCPFGALGVTPYPTTVRTYRNDVGVVIVEAWLVHGLSHNYSGGTFDGTYTDPYGPDITAAAWHFFTSRAAPT